MTEAEIRRELTERAQKLFGNVRASELAPDIEQLSAEVFKLQSYQIGPTDEP